MGSGKREEGSSGEVAEVTEAIPEAGSQRRQAGECNHLQKILEIWNKKRL